VLAAMDRITVMMSRADSGWRAASQSVRLAKGGHEPNRQQEQDCQ